MQFVFLIVTHWIVIYTAMDSAIHLLNNRGRVNNQSLIQSTHVIQLTLTLTMTTAQVVEMSATVNNSPIQDYVHPDDHIFDLLYSFFRQHINCIGWYTKVRTTKFFFFLIWWRANVLYGGAVTVALEGIYLMTPFTPNIFRLILSPPSPLPPPHL